MGGKRVLRPKFTLYKTANILKKKGGGDTFHKYHGKGGCGDN